MSVDGAHFGMAADDSMKAVLGAEQDEMPQRTPEELRVEIEANADPNSYSGASNVIALGLLRLFDQRPETRDWPADPEGAFFQIGTDLPATTEQLGNADFGAMEWRPRDEKHLSEAFKAIASPVEAEAFSECTGFMWGWAVNAAKYIVGAPPVPNPAILEF